MKKQLVILSAVAGLALGASIALAGSTNGSGIVGSKHDMRQYQTGAGVSYETSGTGKQRVCAFCHTPHHKVENAALDYNPLWSHDVNDDQNWIPYESATFEAGHTTDVLSGPSRLCMSCHDGLIAVDQHYGVAGSASKAVLSSDEFGGIAVGLGNDVSNDHPIGFIIDDVFTKDGKSGGMTFGAAALNENLVAPQNGALTGKKMTDLGFKGLVAGKSVFTCASCHEVHNKDSVEDAFLYEKQAGSQFCLMCHNK